MKKPMSVINVPAIPVQRPESPIKTRKKSQGNALGLFFTIAQKSLP